MASWFARPSRHSRPSLGSPRCLRRWGVDFSTQWTSNLRMSDMLRYYKHKIGLNRHYMVLCDDQLWYIALNVMPGRSGWDHLNAGRTQLAELCYFLHLSSWNKHTTPMCKLLVGFRSDQCGTQVQASSLLLQCICRYLEGYDFFCEVIHECSFAWRGLGPCFRIIDESGLRWVISGEAILQSLPLPPPRGNWAFSIGGQSGQSGQCPCHMAHLDQFWIKGPWTSGDLQWTHTIPKVQYHAVSCSIIVYFCFVFAIYTSQCLLRTFLQF